jgi:hypothetical protein
MAKLNKFAFLSAVIFVAAFAFLNFFGTAYAITPSLSLASNNDGDSVQLNVTGDPNVSVLFYYMKTGVGVQIVSLGATNSAGSFSTSVSTSSYQIVADSSVHVILNGINGTPSNSLIWPVSVSTNSNTLSLSQTGVVITVGSSATITATDSSSGSLYLSNNSNPLIANITLSGNQIIISANTYGSTVATICRVSNTSNCASIYVTVQNSGTSALTFGQNNITISSGQNVPVSISGGNGIYIVQNNPNSSVVQTSINGSTITLSTTSSSGSSTITICSTNMSACGIINVTVGTASSSTITFSQTNPSISVGQSTNISISGGSGTYYISNNSNSSIVQATLSGSILTLLGNTSGSSLITVCSSTGGCGSITVTSNYVSTGGPITLSQTSLTLLTSQTLSVTVSGGETPYSLSYNSNNIFQASLNGNTISVYGVGIGSSSLNVCSGGGACTTLSISVNTTGSTSQPYFGQNNISLTIGQSTTVSLSGNGGYYISNNSNSGVASVQINVNSITIYAVNAGSTNISVCQSGGQCNMLYVSVNSSSQTATLTASSLLQTVAAGSVASFTAAATGFTSPSFSLTDSFSGTSVSNSKINSLGYFNWTPSQSDIGIHNITIYATDSYGHSATAVTQIVVTQSTTQTSSQISYYNFSRYLGYGDKGDDVLQLQNLLSEKGFLTATPNGHYGPATKLAVQKFQKANGIKQTGNVGQLTKAALNQISMSGSNATTTTKEQQISTIQQAIAQLLAQITQLQGQ